MAHDRHSQISVPPALNAQTECITITSHKRDIVKIMVGSEDLPNGLRKFYVSRPHIENLSDRWHEIIERNTYRTRFSRRRVTRMIRFDDDANAMRIVLYIAHAQPTKVPERLGLNEVVQVTKIAQRYDLNYLLYSHLDKWMRQLPIMGPHLTPGYEELLYICWQFGLKRDFFNVAQCLANCYAVDHKGEFVLPSTNHILTTHAPKRVVGSLPSGIAALPPEAWLVPTRWDREQSNTATTCA
ncbi:hypothetical protein EK21DRAFT_106189 [Setomelanomma holmii]|uniref:Uncharacterized protein n=1 Tax=Setomelanomma holmii TaxID=210430 RepID=A0A9P4HM54_9PLEO|nr:hypothetical protein EK21DRAFT_106189 [Setomelanomma holmii]